VTAPYRFVFASDLGDALRREAIAFWQRHGALPVGVDPAERAAQLVAAAKDAAGEIAGVSTAFKAVHPRLEQLMFHLRVFVAPSARRQHLSVDLTNASLRHLEQLNAALPEHERALGAIAEMQTEHYKTGGTMARKAVWPTGFTFIGRTPAGDHLRVVYFQGAELRFGRSPPKRDPRTDT
jgi:GNAT superfamily N-acetyltransferase